MDYLHAQLYALIELRAWGRAVGNGDVPFELRSLDAAAAGGLLGYEPRTVREDLASKPGFPKRVDAGGNPRWIAGELMAWRESNRAVERESVRKKKPK